jgi:hypothetical protein
VYQVSTTLEIRCTKFYTQRLPLPTISVHFTGGRRTHGPPSYSSRRPKVQASEQEKHYKSSPFTRHGGAWGERSIAPTHSRPRHYMGGEWSASRTGRALPPRKGPPVPIVQEAGWAPEPVWTQRLEEKSSASAGDRTPIAQSSSP